MRSFSKPPRAPWKRHWPCGQDVEALYASQMGSTLGRNFEDVLPTMTMPCLVYVGEGDPRFDAITRAAGLMPNVTFFTLPDRDHSATHRDAEAVVSHAIPFLGNVTMKAAR